MAQDSLSILLQTNTSNKDTLSEQWGVLLANFAKGTISANFKNRQLSGDPTAGVMNAKRFANAVEKEYGTARAARAAEKVKALPVPVPITDHKEWLEEVEEWDVRAYGVDGIITSRTQNQQGALKRYFERKFYKTGYLGGEVFAVSGSTVPEKLESIIQKLETVQNDFVDGIDRMDMVLVLDTATYGAARSYIDTVSLPNIDSSIGEFGMFHGVKAFSSIYLPATVNYFIFRDEAIAQPIHPTLYDARVIELSKAMAFGAFTDAGNTAVMPDLIFFAGTLGTATLTTVYGGASNKSTITPTSALSDSGNSFWYLAHASAVAAPTYGADAEDAGYTQMTLTSGAQAFTFATETKIRVAEVDASGRIIKVSAETTIVKSE